MLPFEAASLAIVVPTDKGGGKHRWTSRRWAARSMTIRPVLRGLEIARSHSGRGIRVKLGGGPPCAHLHGRRNAIRLR